MGMCPIRCFLRCRRILGGQKTQGLMKGTMKWKIEDDTGTIHIFKITNAYYSPQGKMRLFSPQQWCGQQHKQTGTQASYEGDETKITLTWHDGKYKKTVPIDHDTNVYTMHLSLGYTHHRAHKMLTLLTHAATHEETQERHHKHQ